MFGSIVGWMLRRRALRRGGERLDVVLEWAPGLGQFQATDVTGMRNRLASRRLSDRKKTVIDCIDRPDLAGGEGEAAIILATVCRRIDWHRQPHIWIGSPPGH